MRIAYVTQWFPPEPAHIAFQIAEGLHDRGHDVSVITGYPNYPHGRIYPGYRQRFGAMETFRDIRVHRTPILANHGTSVFGRMANYGSFALSASWAARKVPGPDVWLTYSSPALAAIPAMLSGARRAPRAMILQDLWPDSVTESSLLPRSLQQVVRGAIGPVSAATYSDAAAIGIISPGMRQVLIDRGVDAGRIHYTPNWEAEPFCPPTDVDVAALRQELGLPQDRRIFLYAGNFGDFQALDLLIKEFADLARAQLLLVGSGSSEAALRGLAEDLPSANVQFVGRQSKASLERYVAACDVQVVSLADRPLMRVTMPSKIQACLAAGKPILAHAVGDVAAVIRDAEAGTAVAPGSAEVKDVLRKFVEMGEVELAALGRNARSTFESQFSREIGLSRVEKMLSSATESALPIL